MANNSIEIYNYDNLNCYGYFQKICCSSDIVTLGVVYFKRSIRRLY